jgi:hypothetical protein
MRRSTPRKLLPDTTGTCTRSPAALMIFSLRNNVKLSVPAEV